MAYLPFGTIEWHGPHLPLGTDTLKIEALVKEAQKISGGLVFPPFTWNRNSIRVRRGVKYEGVDFMVRRMLPGNIHFLQKGTFNRLVKDMVGTCLKRGFKVVCVWSGHTAVHLQRDIPALNIFFKNKYPHQRVLICANEALLITPLAFKKYGVTIGPDHAGKWESSIMLATHPRLMRLKTLINKNLASLCITDNSVLQSSAALGKKIIHLCGQAMGKTMLNLLKAVHSS